MNSADLADMLDLMAQALRAMPAGASPAAPQPPAAPGRTLGEWLVTFGGLLSERGYKAQTLKNRFANLAHVRRLWGHSPITALEWPSLHEVRSLSARLYTAQGVDVQTLLGHKHAQMTAVYQDDRGLSAHVWKQVGAQSIKPDSLAVASA